MNENKQIIGTFEKVSFPTLGVKNVVAKIDTGAYTGAFHCTKIEEVEVDGSKELHFVPFNDAANAQTVTDYYSIPVTSSNGVTERRFVVRTKIVIRGNTYPIKLTLSNREGMKYEVLIGRRFLRKNNLVVDAAQYKK